MKDDLIARLQKDVADEQNHRDGIPQIAVGAFLVISMLLMMSGKGNTFVVLIPLMPMLIEGLRKRITYPRVGYAKVMESKAGRKPIMWAILAMLVAGATVFFLRMAKPEALPQAGNPHFLIMWAIAILIILFGVVFLKRRPGARLTWSLVAVLAILASVIVFKLHKDAVYKVVMAFGAVQIITGLYCMRSFIRDYPVLKDE